MTTDNLKIEAEYTYENHEDKHVEIHISSFSQSRVIVVIGTKATLVLGLEEAQWIANKIQKVIDSTVKSIEELKAQ